MPRVHHRKARKDYPANGIEKGDMYYYTKIKTGPRSSRVMRSKTPFKQSQLTTSPFKSGWYGIEEAWDESSKDAEAMREAAEAMRELGEEANNSYEAMPEGLQEGETGQLLYARAEGCESGADELEGFADEWEGMDDLEEPEAVEEPDTDEADDDPAWEAFNQYQDDLSDYEQAVSDQEQERESLRDQAQDIINSMPEY